MFPAPAVLAPLAAADRSPLPGVAELRDELRARGWQHGALLGIHAPPSAAVARLLQAAWGEHLVPVLYHRRWSQSQLAAAVATTGCPVHVTGDADLPPDPTGPDAPLASAREEPALVCFSSGSSGRPRALVHGRPGLALAAHETATALGLGPADCWALCLPLDHVGGALPVYRSLVSGCRLQLWPRFDPQALSAAIDAGTVTGVSLVPVMLARLLDARGQRPWPASLRCLLLGGDGLAPELAARSGELGRWPCRSYGLSEFASAVAMQDSEGEPGDDCGPLLASCSAELRAGRLLLRGARCALAEIQAPGRLAPLGDASGRYDTGDLAELSDDGRLRIHGRADQRIVSGGETVDPLAVEAVLAGHPAVQACAVIGLPDPEWGEQVAAAVVGEELDLGALTAWCREQLPPAQRPRAWQRLAALPTTASGKLDRRALRAHWPPGPEQALPSGTRDEPANSD